MTMNPSLPADTDLTPLLIVAQDSRGVVVVLHPRTREVLAREEVLQDVDGHEVAVMVAAERAVHEALSPKIEGEYR